MAVCQPAAVPGVEPSRQRNLRSARFTTSNMVAVGRASSPSPATSAGRSTRSTPRTGPARETAAVRRPSSRAHWPQWPVPLAPGGGGRWSREAPSRWRPCSQPRSRASASSVPGATCHHQPHGEIPHPGRGHTSPGSGASGPLSGAVSPAQCSRSAPPPLPRISSAPRPVDPAPAGVVASEAVVTPTLPPAGGSGRGERPGRAGPNVPTPRGYILASWRETCEG